MLCGDLGVCMLTIIQARSAGLGRGPPRPQALLSHLEDAETNAVVTAQVTKIAGSTDTLI